MRKIVTGIVMIQVILLLMSAGITAAAPAASLTGPSAVRAGDTFKITLSLSGTGLSSVMGDIRYDAAKLTVKSTAVILTSWTVYNMDTDTAGKVSFWLDDKDMVAPINSSKQLFSISFQVKSGVAAGTTIAISTENLAASDGTSDFTPSAAYSVNALAPLSSNTNLSTLTVGNATLTPVFSKTTTSYTAAVPFTVSALDIIAKTEDAKAKATISGNNLAAGKTSDVTITVTAENGVKKSYIIHTSRADDPNSKLSSNASLSEIAVEHFSLFPVFNPAVTLYVVLLPYEVTEIKVTGKTEDEKASVDVVGGSELKYGEDNIIKVIGTAQDGSTKEYTIVVRRIAESGLFSQTTESTIFSDEGENRPASSGTPAWIVFLTALVCIGIGFAGGVYARKKEI